MKYCRIYILSIFYPKKSAHGSLIDKVQFVAGPGDDVLIIVHPQLSMDRRADHPPMACQKDTGILWQYAWMRHGSGSCGFGFVYFVR